MNAGPPVPAGQHTPLPSSMLQPVTFNDEPDAGQHTPPPFDGHQPRECGIHHYVGWRRAWCEECTEWCYPDHGCKGCRLGAVRDE